MPKYFYVCAECEKLWDKPMKLTELKTIRTKLKDIMSKDA